MMPYYLQKNDKIDKDKIDIDKFEDKIIIEDEINNINRFSPDSLVSMTRKHLSSCCLAIADKTISIKFHKFNTPRTDPKELIFNNIKTYNLSAAEIEKYLDAVKNISGNGKIIDQKINVNDINIDQTGFSLELAKELGMDYLRGNYIIVSIKQKDCGIIRRYTSFASTVLRKLFELHYKYLEQILIGEALIGRMSIPKASLFEILENYPESIFNIDMYFDTPTGAISKLKKIQYEEDKLFGKIKLIKDRKFLENLLNNIEDVSSKHGSIERIPISSIFLENKLDSYKLDFNDLDIYCINFLNKPIFIYFDSNGSLDKNYLRENAIILNGKNIESINTLVDMKIVGYNPNLGLERAINMIVLNRKEKLYKYLEKNPESSEDIKKFFLDRLMVEEDIPENVKDIIYTIESFIKNGIDKNFFYGLGKNKIYMVYPLIQDEIIYEILSRMENDNIKSTYLDTNSFIDKISKMNDDELINVLTEILSGLEFKEENNLIVNGWLRENKKELCKEFGIRFIEKNK